MKKLSVLVLSFLMIFSFVSCQNESSEITTAASSAITADQTPVISGADDVTILQGATFDIMEGVTAYDLEDGDLTSAIQTDGFVDSTILGEHRVTNTVESATHTLLPPHQKYTPLMKINSPIATLDIMYFCALFFSTSFPGAPCQ